MLLHSLQLNLVLAWAWNSLGLLFLLRDLKIVLNGSLGLKYLIMNLLLLGLGIDLILVVLLDYFSLLLRLAVVSYLLLRDELVNLDWGNVIWILQVLLFVIDNWWEWRIRIRVFSCSFVLSENLKSVRNVEDRMHHLEVESVRTALHLSPVVGWVD